MKKYTPGPWIWKLSGYYYELVSYLPGKYYPNGEPCYFSIMDDGSACGEYSPEIEHDSADATLIAAAPDLFEALELIIPLAKAAYINAPPEEGNYKGAKKTRDRWIEVAEAALAKAKGEPTCSPE